MKTSLFVALIAVAATVGILPLFIGLNPIVYLATVGIAWGVRGTYIARWTIAMYRRIRGL